MSFWRTWTHHYSPKPYSNDVAREAFEASHCQPTHQRLEVGTCRHVEDSQRHPGGPRESETGNLKFADAQLIPQLPPSHLDPTPDIY